MAYLTRTRPYPVAREGITFLRSLFYVKTAKIRTPVSWYNKIGADAFALDLEDAVPEEHKERVRHDISNVLAELRDHQLPHLLVRINPLSEGYHWLKDVEATQHHRLLGYIVSKVEHRDQLKEISYLLGSIEHRAGLQPNHFKLVPLIETALGVTNAQEIAHASPRNIAMLVGRYDLIASTGCTLDSSLMKQACNDVAMAARSAKVLPLLSSYCELDNYTYYRKESEEARRCGFMGRSALTPQQVIIANETFGISAQERERALALLQAADGLTTHADFTTRHMVGPPHQKRALRLLARTELQARYDESAKERLVVANGNGTNGKGLTRTPKSPVSLVPERMRIGEFVASPFELTLNEGMRAAWEQHFLPYSKLATSDLFARELGFDCVQVPFGLLMNLAMSLSVAVFSKNAKLHMEIVKAEHLAPVSYGDTVRNFVRTLSVDEKSDCLVVLSEHILNACADDRPILQVLKRTMFPKGCSNFDTGDAIEENKMENRLKAFLSTCLPSAFANCSRGQRLAKGDLIVHEMVKSFGPHDAVTLSYFLKGTNPLHINTVRFKSNDLLVSGPCVVAATLANQCTDFGDVLYEELSSFKSVNKVHSGDMISSISFVADVKDSPLNSSLEHITLIVVGVRNVDTSVLANLAIPLSLFSVNNRPKEIEQICADSCTELYHNVAAIGERHLLRRRPAETDLRK